MAPRSQLVNSEFLLPFPNTQLISVMFSEGLFIIIIYLVSMWCILLMMHEDTRCDKTVSRRQSSVSGNGIYLLLHAIPFNIAPENLRWLETCGITTCSELSKCYLQLF